MGAQIVNILNTPTHYQISENVNYLIINNKTLINSINELNEKIGDRRNTILKTIIKNDNKK